MDATAEPDESCIPVLQNKVCRGGQRSVHAGLVHRASGSHAAALPDRRLASPATHLQSSRLFHVSALLHPQQPEH